MPTSAATGFGDPSDGFIDRLAADRRAAGRIDPHDDGLDARLVLQPVEQFEKVPILGDDAFDRDAGDLIAAARSLDEGRDEGSDPQKRDEDGDDSPERDLAPKRSAVDNVVGAGHERLSMRCRNDRTKT